MGVIRFNNIRALHKFNSLKHFVDYYSLPHLWMPLGIRNNRLQLIIIVLQVIVLGPQLAAKFQNLVDGFFSAYNPKSTDYRASPPFPEFSSGSLADLKVEHGDCKTVECPLILVYFPLLLPGQTQF
ncbi:hypothetical protein HAX54_030700 [Datura stramonium]|uniref:Uncharacterized protein n=1 Tax=Datura stramonium TaxID=4076 RepID=A0ABS8SB78_DATST|nr:hypothetical protein [Datura stramonium]